MGNRILLATTVIWPSAARLAGAFAGTGARVDAVFPRGHMIARSRYLSRGHGYSPLSARTSVANAVIRSEPDLIVPCDDRATGLLLDLAARDTRFTALIAHSLGQLVAYRDLISRSTFIQAARHSGIRAPETVAIADEGQLALALASFGFPAVLKADASNGGDGVAIVRSVDQARKAFRRLSAAASPARNLVRALKRRDAHFLRDAFHPPRPGISLQRFVSGRPATTAFACWKGRVLAAIHMDVLESLGETGPASVLRRSDCADMHEAAVRIAARFGLSGLHGLDFVRDAEGRVHLIEINPRATQSSPLALGPGHDVVAALAAGTAGEAIVARPMLTDSPVIALFPQEWRRNPHSDWLSAAYLDAPWDDPGVLNACLADREQLPIAKPVGASRLRLGALTVRQAVGR